MALLLIVAAPPSWAGVPRVCIHPDYDPLRCPAALREQHRQVLPSRRLRALEAQRTSLEQPVRIQEREARALLREIRDSVSPAIRRSY